MLSSLLLVTLALATLSSATSFTFHPSPTPTFTALAGSRAADKAATRVAWYTARGGATSVPSPSSSSPSTPLRVIITGAPASGKGTQCAAIVKNYRLVHLSTGDMLRKAIADKTPVGLSAQEFMTKGDLVPDEVVCGIVADRLANPDCVENGVLLDGFPRTEVQAKVLKELLAEKKSAIDLVIFLNVDEEKLVERVVGRRVDPETGDSYHTAFNWPEDMSQEVKGRLIQRDDDTEEKCKVRLEQYRKNVEAIRGFYSDIGVEVDGNDKPEEVGVQIEKVMQDAKAKME